MWILLFKAQYFIDKQLLRLGMRKRVSVLILRLPGRLLKDEKKLRSTQVFPTENSGSAAQNTIEITINLQLKYGFQF